DRAKGYQMTMGLFSVLCVVFFIVAFATTKERIQPDPLQKSSLMQDLADLFKNASWIALFLVTTFYFMAISIRGSVMLPFFKYCSGHEQLFSWFNGFGLTSLLVGVAVSNSLALRLGKRRLFVLSMLLAAVFNIALILIPPTATLPIFISEILRQFAYGWSCPLLWAMMAALAGWLFSFYGYVPNAAQTAHAIQGIRLTASVYAGVAFLVTAGCLFFYPITKELNRQIADELTERRKGYAS